MSMIKWNNVKDRLPNEKVNFYKKYLVTVKSGNNGERKTMVMTYEPKGKKRILTWCWVELKHLCHGRCCFGQNCQNHVKMNFELKRLD